MSRPYQVCTFCVMDTSNPFIEFDALGRCDCCRKALIRRPHEWWIGAEGQARMDAMVARLREEGKGQTYDAMVGLSGGVDSAYLAHLMRDTYGLRLLAVHVDGGWNSAPAVRNIEVLVRRLDIDLFTHVVEWTEMRDLQLAFLKASVLNQDIPQDHAFFATLYRTARRFQMRYFLSGVNYATESIIPPNWGFPAMDGKHVRGVHQRFGQRKLQSYPIMSLPEFLWIVRLRGQLSVIRPLNFLNYDKRQAKQELMRLYGWQDYGEKHNESRFTKFYQDIYLPRKLNFDKRRLHLSSLIVSSQMTREEALKELEQPIIDPAQTRRDTKFVAKKLGIDVPALERLIDQPLIDHQVYPNQLALHSFLTGMRGWFRNWRKRLLG
ncbi:MAG TPA: N-acetyl sugar amidotransferase [Pirellulaceae bacterium]